MQIKLPLHTRSPIRPLENRELFVKKSKASTNRSGSSIARLAIRFVIGVIILLGSVGLFGFLAKNRPAPAHVTDHSQSRLVSVIEARELPIARRYSGFGSTRAIRETTVAAEVSARVTNRPDAIRAGQRIEQGEPIISLDNEVFTQRLNAAQGALDALNADLDSLDVELESTQERLRLSEQAITLLDNELTELESALERGAAVKIEVDRLRRERTSLESERETLRQILSGIPSRRASIEARVASQRAELALARIDLNRTTIQAPISGILAEIFVDEGDSVSPGTRICRIVDLSVIEVPLRLPAAAATQVTTGARAIIEETTTEGRIYNGTVIRVAPEIDPATRTITVFVEVRQDPSAATTISTDLLLPGQFVSGRVITETTRQCLAVPRLAVKSDRVMVFDPETATAQPRTAPIDFYTDHVPGDTNGWDQWAILDPTVEAQDWQAPRLKPGELVIVSNLDELPPGTPVRLEPQSGSAVAP